MVKSPFIPSDPVELRPKNQTLLVHETKLPARGSEIRRLALRGPQIRLWADRRQCHCLEAE